MVRLRALGTSGSQVIGQFMQSQPYRYEVIGLPTGSSAMLARLAGVWKVLKTEGGKSSAWTGGFVTAEDALASIDKPSGCGPLLIPIVAAKVLA